MSNVKYESPIDYIKLTLELRRFTEYVYAMEHRESGAMDPISFSDSSSYLGMVEGYKGTVGVHVRQELHSELWKPAWIGTGRIAKYAIRAFSIPNNLVGRFQQMHIKNCLTRSHPDFNPNAEHALYQIYRGTNEAAAFAEAVSVFGAKYDVLGFLFYVKDDQRFVPIRASFFDQALAYLNIPHRLSFSCNWNNYNAFINIVKVIQDTINVTLPLKADARLIDAHSFLWTIHQKQYQEWKPNIEQEIQIENETESYIACGCTDSPHKSIRNTSTYSRSVEVANVTKDRANGICELCKQPAPFVSKEGVPYLEAHHIIWLSRGGSDHTNNTVALCPNCHKKMHVLDKEDDIAQLLNLRATKQ